MVERIVCMSGIPGMGKSTYAKSLGIKIINADHSDSFLDDILFHTEDFVFDWIFLSVLERTKCVYDLRQLYPSAKLEVHWFKPDLDLIVSRRGYPLDRAKRYANAYEFPTYNEGWDIIKEVQ
jgi:hypothetical protein